MIAGIGNMVCMSSDAKEGFLAAPVKVYFWVPSTHTVKASGRRSSTETTLPDCHAHESPLLHQPQFRRAGLLLDFLLEGNSSF